MFDTQRYNYEMLDYYDVTDLSECDERTKTQILENDEELQARDQARREAAYEAWFDEQVRQQELEQEAMMREREAEHE